MKKRLVTGLLAVLLFGLSFYGSSAFAVGSGTTYFIFKELSQSCRIKDNGDILDSVGERVDCTLSWFSNCDYNGCKKIDPECSQ